MDDGVGQVFDYKHRTPIGLGAIEKGDRLARFGRNVGDAIAGLAVKQILLADRVDRLAIAVLGEQGFTILRHHQKTGTAGFGVGRDGSDEGNHLVLGIRVRLKRLLEGVDPVEVDAVKPSFDDAVEVGSRLGGDKAQQAVKRC